MSKAIQKLTTLLDPKSLKSSKTTGRGKMKIVSWTGNERFKVDLHSSYQICTVTEL